MTNSLEQQMRHWLGGAQRYPPDNLRFDCGPEVLERVRHLPHAVPSSRAEPGNRIATPWMDGILVVLDDSLPATGWKLVNTVFGTPIWSALRPPFNGGTAVFREGDIRGGRPTALEREYWLADITLSYRATHGYAWAADEWVRRSAVRHAFACGHEIDPALTKVRSARLGPHLLDDWGFEVTVSAPREPVRYPVCGDWLCPDDADWAHADPVDEPAVFAGAVTEKRYVDNLLGTGIVYFPADLFREALAGRRRQAKGAPLWTIDVRPRREP